MERGRGPGKAYEELMADEITGGLYVLGLSSQLQTHIQKEAGWVWGSVYIVNLIQLRSKWESMSEKDCLGQVDLWACQ